MLSGAVTNTGPVSLTNIEVSVALYDGDGNVALVLQASTVSVPFEPAEGAKLRPGQTGTFAAQVATAELLAIAGSVRVVCFVNAAPAS